MFSWSSTTSSSAILAEGNLVLFRAAITASSQASKRFPQLSIICKSINNIQTCLPSSTHNLSKSTSSLSRIPLSTTRASSIESSLGGPGSKVGSAIGSISQLVIKTPKSGVSGNGAPICGLIPTIT